MVRWWDQPRAGWSVPDLLHNLPRAFEHSSQLHQFRKKTQLQNLQWCATMKSPAPGTGGSTRGLQHLCPCWGSHGTLTPSLSLGMLVPGCHRAALPQVTQGRRDAGVGCPGVWAAMGHGNRALSTRFLRGTKYSLSLPRWGQTPNVTFLSREGCKS